MSRDENLSIIRQFLDEYNEETGDHLEITQAAPETPENVDDKPLQDVVDEVSPEKKKKKRPSLSPVEAPKVTDMPTPGGIMFLLFTVIFILFAIVPTKNGGTRLSLMWSAFLGNASLNETSSAGQSSGSSQALTPQGGMYTYSHTHTLPLGIH